MCINFSKFYIYTQNLLKTSRVDSILRKNLMFSLKKNEFDVILGKIYLLI